MDILHTQKSLKNLPKFPAIFTSCLVYNPNILLINLANQITASAFRVQAEFY